MRDDRGEWIPWYCDDSATWLELSLAARGIAEGIARKMGRHRSTLHLGSRGLRGLCVILGAKWTEFEPAMAELLSGEHPRLVLTEDQRVLIDPDHESRQRPSSSERVARHRAKSQPPPPVVADLAPNVTPVTPETLVTPVTGGDACNAASPLPLFSSDLISSLPEADQKILAGGDRGSGAGRVLLPDEPLTPKREGYVETVRISTGRPLDARSIWQNFVNDRIEKTVLYASEGAIDAGWRKWVDRQAKWDAEAGSGKRLRVDTRQPLRNPEAAEWLKKATGGDF